MKLIVRIFIVVTALFSQQVLVPFCHLLCGGVIVVCKLDCASVERHVQYKPVCFGLRLDNHDYRVVTRSA